MPKRGVNFVKPEEPAFLKRMKDEIGYREPEASIDAKRASLGNFNDDEDEDYEAREDEKPLVVQVKAGDLTEEEAAKMAKEEAQKPADLTQKIVFKGKKKDAIDNESSKKETGEKCSKRKKRKPAKNVLSFQEDDDDE